MPRLFRTRFLSDEAERASRLKNALLHFIEGPESLAARGYLDLFHGDQLVLQPLHTNLSILDENVRRTFHELLQLAMFVEVAHHQSVDEQERCCADQASGHGVVVAD